MTVSTTWRRRRHASDGMGTLGQLTSPPARTSCGPRNGPAGALARVPWRDADCDPPRRGLSAVWSFLGPYTDEWRGNKIASHKVHLVKGAPAGSPARIVDLCTSPDIIQQIKLTSGTPCRDLEVPNDLTATFSHRLYFPEGPGFDAERVLSLLGKVLSIRIPNLDVAIAFDWYKIPPDEEHPEWRDTGLGLLRKKAKFYVSSPHIMEASREQLTNITAQFMGLHPLYGAADVIIATPGHDRSQVSCGEDLARRLAAATDKRVVITETAYDVREQVKGDGPVSLEDQFSMPTSLSDLSVIVFDDVIKSGKTMKHMALAARRAGAARVLGLAPVRTMRGS